MASKRLINLRCIRKKTHFLHIKMVFWKTYIFFKEVLELNLERDFLMDGIIEWKIKIHENCKYKRKITCFKKSASPKKKHLMNM
jgi:hypothetical protein